MDPLTRPNELVITADGSATLRSGLFGVHYHSVHGAVQESKHVFIRSGLHPLLKNKKEIHILEMGFGTGLNAWLTLAELSQFPELAVRYTAYERYPITEQQAASLNYAPPDQQDAFLQLHRATWEQWEQIHPQFALRKLQADLETSEPDGPFDLVYYDAFAPDVQPGLWSEALFSRLYLHLNPGALLVTYCAKGSVKRALKAAGFSLERLPGPPHKRHMLRAGKEIHAV